MFENPSRGPQARNFTTKVPKILDLKSSSEQIFSKNCRWVPLTNIDQRKMLVRPEYKREEEKAIQIRQSPALKSVPNPGPLQIMEPSVAYIYLLVSIHKPRVRVFNKCTCFLAQTLPTIDTCICLMLGLLVKYCLCHLWLVHCQFWDHYESDF